jgi:hypothetical protein
MRIGGSKIRTFDFGNDTTTRVACLRFDVFSGLPTLVIPSPPPSKTTRTTWKTKPRHSFVVALDRSRLR